MDRNFYFSDKDADWVVALRKESVDRNIIYLLTASGFIMSLSARRAWIEIGFGAKLVHSFLGRSPQGERG